MDRSGDFGVSWFDQIVYAAGFDDLLLLDAGPELGFLGQKVLAEVFGCFQRILTRASVSILLIVA